MARTKSALLARKIYTLTHIYMYIYIPLGKREASGDAASRVTKGIIASSSCLPWRRRGRSGLVLLPLPSLTRTHVNTSYTHTSRENSSTLRRSVFARFDLVCFVPADRSLEAASIRELGRPTTVHPSRRSIARKVVQPSSNRKKGALH